MRSISLTVGPLIAGNAALLVASVIPTSGTALTLTGSQPDKARRLLLTFGNEASNRTLVLTGKNASGDTITETIAVASGAGGTAVSVLDYLTLTSAVPAGGGWTAAVTLGTVTSGVSSPVASSSWIRCDDFGFANTALNVDVSGTINYTVESSDDDPNLVAPQTVVAPSAMTWIGHGSLQGITVSQHDGYTYTPRWVRITENSGGVTASATLTVTQPGGRLG